MLSTLEKILCDTMVLLFSPTERKIDGEMMKWKK